VLGQKRLSTWADLWHQTGMAETKKNAAVAALGRVDYSRLFAEIGAVPSEATGAGFVEQLLSLWKAAYLLMTPHVVDTFVVRHGSFQYMFDDYATLEATGKVPYNPVFEARLVAAAGWSKPQSGSRDDYRLKGWVGPTEAWWGRKWDKGHFIAHSIGGAVDQCELNVFIQRRSLNRGWSKAGKRYRLMEKYCFENPGTFCFSRPIYADGAARPAALEFGVVRVDGKLWLEVYDNS
jgi:hypothetical protein